MSDKQNKPSKTVFVSPIITARFLGYLIDSGQFEKWFKSQLRKRDQQDLKG